MERIKEKPALTERVKEKIVSAPRELLHKGFDDGADRLRTQFRDTAQQGRRDEYGGDAIEDTAANSLRRAKKELLKQRKKKTAEQSASPQGDADTPNSGSDAPPIIRTKETDAARSNASSPPQVQAQQAAMKQAVKTKNTYINARDRTHRNGSAGATATGPAGIHPGAGAQSIPPAGTTQTGRTADSAKRCVVRQYFEVGRFGIDCADPVPERQNQGAW